MKNIKEQFETAIYSEIDIKLKVTKWREAAIKCESISDSMAIEFATWVLKNVLNNDQFELSKDLLLEFKQEFYTNKDK